MNAQLAFGVGIAIGFILSVLTALLLTGSLFGYHPDDFYDVDGEGEGRRP